MMQNVDSDNKHEDPAGVASADVDFLRSITSSEDNALLLEKLVHDECHYIGISRDEDFWDDENDFVLREGDDLFYLGYFIGKSNRLESLSLSQMPVNNSFRDGLAVNKSIQVLYIQRDLGQKGFQSLAPFLRSTNTLKELFFDANFISRESMKSIALLLSQYQIPSLKEIYVEDVQFGDEGYVDIARAMSMQPQLEILSLTYLNEDHTPFHQGHITLGETMKHWKSPCLRTLDLESSHINDDDMLALVEGMANCSNLERLCIAGNETITEIGLRALSSLFQSKKFSLCSFDLRDMNITDGGMTALETGLASLKLLNRLDLSNNSIGDVGLEALAAGLVGLLYLEVLALRNNAAFSAIGLTSLSRVLQTSQSLEYLDLSSNSIDDEGLHAFTKGMKKSCTIESLILTNNAISSGVQSLAEMSSLRRLHIRNNNIGDNDKAMEALVEAMESLCNLEYLGLNGITSSGLSVFAPGFQCERSFLQELDLCATNIEDCGAIALANGLRGNKSLTKVCFDHRGLTNVGWSAFERLLCDTSSINKTYCSNHTLENIGNSYRDDYPASMKVLLRLNEQKDEGVNVPIRKILMSHSDFDMTPLLQWKLKLLPFVVTWFERARSSQPTRSRFALKERNLSAVYQFVCGVSHTVVEDYASNEISSAAISPTPKKRKINHAEAEACVQIHRQKQNRRR